MHCLEAIGLSYGQVAGVELAFICLLVLCTLCYHEYQIQTKVDSKEFERSENKKGPAHRYRDYEHSSEGEHRTAEQKNWVFTKYINILIAGIAVIAAFFAGWTWFETRDQARTAAGQLALAKSQEVKQLRAYLSIEPGIIENFGANQVPTIHVRSNNFGQTPGSNVEVQVQAVVLPYEYGGIMNIQEAPFTSSNASSRSDIFPNHPQDIQTVREQNITPEEYTSVIYGKKHRFFIYGIAVQNDVFGGSEVRHFCFDYFPPDSAPTLTSWAYCQGRRNYSEYQPELSQPQFLNRSNK